MNHSHTEERTLEFVPENIVQLHQALCKLMAALMEYLGVGYQARGEENSKRWRHLNWVSVCLINLGALIFLRIADRHRLSQFNTNTLLLTLIGKTKGKEKNYVQKTRAMKEWHLFRNEFFSLTKKLNGIHKN